MWQRKKFGDFREAPHTKKPASVFPNSKNAHNLWLVKMKNRLKNDPIKKKISLWQKSAQLRFHKLTGCQATESLWKSRWWKPHFPSKFYSKVMIMTNKIEDYSKQFSVVSNEQIFPIHILSIYEIFPLEQLIIISNILKFSWCGEWWESAQARSSKIWIKVKFENREP